MYDNKPKIPFEFRHKMSKWNQDLLNERHEWWQITGCRKDFTCMNNECAVRVHKYQYYYKYHNEAWRHIPYFLKMSWARVCSDCYHDHIIPASSPRWQRHQDKKLEEMQMEVENTYPQFTKEFTQAREELEGETQ